MTDPGPFATRRELDMQRSAADAEHARFRSDLHALDAGGSRGVVGLQVQVADLAKEVANLQASVDALRADMDRRFDAHMKVHQDDAGDRISSRRFRVTATIAAAVAAAAVITLLITIVSRLHG